jgi:hypothetical protein
VYSSIIININDLNIMVIVNNVYFEYIKILCEIFAKYIDCAHITSLSKPFYYTS